MSLPLMPQKPNSWPRRLRAYRHAALSTFATQPCIQTTRHPRTSTTTSIPSPRHIYIQRPVQYRPSPCSASSSSLWCLGYDLRSSDWKYASSFLQIPPRGGHPWCSLSDPAATACKTRAIEERQPTAPTTNDCIVLIGVDGTSARGVGGDASFGREQRPASKVVAPTLSG